MYLIAITIGLCITYAGLTVLYPYFFNTGKVSISNIQIRSLAIIITLSIFGYIVAFTIPNIELSNRILHGFGGGFMSLVTCFLAGQDSQISIDRVRFLFFSLLIVSALGVSNEIFEFFLQNYMGWTFAITINDTWHDLISNLIGSVIGGICLFPFVDFKN